VQVGAAGFNLGYLVWSRAAMISIWQDLKRRILFWRTQSQDQSSSREDWVALPDTLHAELTQSIHALASPEAYQTAIHTALEDGIKAWQQRLEAANSLIILGNPVEPIAKILQDSLQTWQDAPDLRVITLLPNLCRPSDPLTMTQQIQTALQAHSDIGLSHSQGSDNPPDTDSLEHRTTVIVIPTLEQCFLRCIGGWDSLELLRNITIHNPHCFWVMGCNHWAWDFLDFVCQISAYFSEVKPLPRLDAAALCDWLNPIASTVVDNGRAENSMAKDSTEPHHQSHQIHDIDPGNADDRRQTYWEALAAQSSGLSAIAANLWLESLRIQQETLDDNAPLLQRLESPDHPLALYEASPVLPSLPLLTDSDRYLLHSVLIHGSITRIHLALSLGEAESQIQARIQWLLRQEVLDRRNGSLSVNPLYYRKVQNELANNNFFVSEGEG
jgi:hypothetical protein